MRSKRDQDEEILNFLRAQQAKQELWAVEDDRIEEMGAGMAGFAAGAERASFDYDHQEEMMDEDWFEE